MINPTVEVGFIIATVVGVVVWIVRLEGKVKNNDARLTTMENAHRDLSQKLDTVIADLQLIKGFLNGKYKD